ncbi:5,10-methylene-tetrahydrofolate dehydrogenase/methenyl tetrahydrofolate cyclohydrolase [Bernardetia litoralis DSM 6794]|uniref:Bifunctional protein FolD n=1 Tax=Bernardetia litoralis (strain ATCC 23117 / DSM 6794 / NBRC 15988 / NCIMB 1366 / Fx l1 / Sio-4) TaxID=880071 RepID=I4AJJ7_BERLS|nr:tetrahydrofolate dehydrogenase/cyclohydrolase catalytic domain-containing protein [Bernardetia litoralis]AFM04132.1 5,10-methylene-tetrahydrofolate dehydrogenase/methenyl tetrahydrofolate cyclohydrolase [Bernardetia litoralis DSM 6794]
MQLIDGKNTAELLKNELAIEVAARKEKGFKTPHLAAILVGEDGASQTYVNSKVKSCEQIGFASTLKHLPATISEEELLKIVEEFNQNDDIDGFIVQLPLPNHIDADKITLAISPEKDVDGFHPSNIGKMVLGLPCYLPATPFGIVKLLEQYNIETSGKHAVVIGRSNIVGSPMSILLARNEKVGNCTVTLTHSRTKNLKELSLQADIIIAAIGKPEFVTADMVKKGAIVIDVGTTRVPDASKKSGFALKGDVKFDEVAPKCSFITPVPGGVGPMTVTALLFNTLNAAKKKDKI